MSLSKVRRKNSIVEFRRKDNHPLQVRDILPYAYVHKDTYFKVELMMELHDYDQPCDMSSTYQPRHILIESDSLFIIDWLKSAGTRTTTVHVRHINEYYLDDNQVNWSLYTTSGNVYMFRAEDAPNLHIKVSEMISNFLNRQQLATSFSFNRAREAMAIAAPSTPMLGAQPHPHPAATKMYNTIATPGSPTEQLLDTYNPSMDLPSRRYLQRASTRDNLGSLFEQHHQQPPIVPVLPNDIGVELALGIVPVAGTPVPVV
ncbi:hypothetical protein SAMD00019534_111190 [Acytostelium subglobosum LB1]|uniref:hypothetical protein n=1 Tax=Acytostelium subglobosum LB1 TaxID=1410327 RepID=UPI000644E831|nr:hypothetical protein SAMD00019534_111190 [Acytostelium subglobosum LB1]GAM27943.1 hypothetical protein SAMD00019534_111190 [Acytostelium subglobosum LB1]|eukprot:XP_012749226.1 hypothetical protein SAMD00019534_111190 [Acytostelium subglobosum LB1]